MKSIAFPPSPDNSGMEAKITFKDEMELQ